MDRPVALSRSRYRERRLNNALMSRPDARVYLQRKTAF